MNRIKIIKDNASEITIRMKELGLKNIQLYISKLIQHDLWIQGLRRRFGIIPFSGHRISWTEFWQLFINKLKTDYQQWRDL